MSEYSVLMSVYKKEKAEYLRASLLSMFHQTLGPDEIVLVKDGPLGEDLEEVINEVDGMYPSVLKVIALEKNLGLGLALQTGLLHCKNELVARMDSDDLARTERMEKQIAYMEAHPECSLCGGWIREFDVEPDRPMGLRKVPEGDEEIKQYLKTRCPFNHMTVLFRKSDVLRSGNYQDFLYNEDYKLWIDMTNAGCTFHNLQMILVDVRSDSGLYARRGGKIYFNSEKKIQDLLLERHLIDKSTYRKNITKRYILQRMCPNSVRGWVFRHFARSKGGEDE